MRQTLDANLDTPVSTRATQSSVDALQSSVDGVQSSVDGMQTSVDGVQSGVSVVGGAVSDVDSAVAGVDAAVATRAGAASINQLSSDLADVTAALADFQARVDTGLDAAATQQSVDQVGATVSSRASQSSVDDVAARLDDLDDLVNGLDLRLAIEEALAEDRVVLSFVLPEPEGHLDLVSQIVWAGIGSVESYGFDGERARRHFAAGEQALFESRFFDAYESFGRAYRELLRGRAGDDDERGGRDGDDDADED